MIEGKTVILDIIMVMNVAWSITLGNVSMTISIVAAIVVMVIRILEFRMKLKNKPKSNGKIKKKNK